MKRTSEAGGIPHSVDLKRKPPENKKENVIAAVTAAATALATAGTIAAERYGVEEFKKAFPIDTTHAQALPPNTASIPKLDLPSGLKVPEPHSTVQKSEVKQAPSPIQTSEEVDLEKQQKIFVENVAELRKLLKNNLFPVTYETTGEAREEHYDFTSYELGTLNMDRSRPNKVDLIYYPPNWDKSLYLKNFIEINHRIKNIPVEHLDAVLKIINKTNEMLQTIRIKGNKEVGIQKFEDGAEELTTVGIRLQLESEKAIQIAMEQIQAMSQP